MDPGPSTTPETTSTRQLRKRRKIDYAEDPKQEVLVEAPKGPKPKQPRQHRYKLTGRLANLLDMPLDILYEIFGHLHPHDLLRLARSTKEFRRVLMSRNSISVWRAARSNLPGMPECPPEMTEPEYANLAFDPRCHHCGATGVRNADWVFRTRICAKCSKDWLEERFDYDPWAVMLSDSEEHTRPFSSDPQPSKIVPTRPGRKHGRKLYVRTEYDQAKKELQALETQEEKEGWLKERTKMIETRLEHANECEKWNSSLSKDRSAELQQLRDERKQAITDKLVALGWKADLDSIRYPDSLADHRLVKQPHRLTERIWINIQPEIIKFMEDMRRKRLARERSELIVRRKGVAIALLRAFKNQRLPPTEAMPEPADFCDFPEISALIEDPSDTELTADSFENVISQLAESILKWRDRITVRLARAPTAPPTRPSIGYRNSYDYDMDFGYNSDSEEEFDEYLLSDLIHDYFLANPFYIPDDEPKGKGKGKEVQDKDEEVDPNELENSLAKLKLAATIFTCASCPTSRFSSYGLFDITYDEDDSGLVSPEPLTYPRVLAHPCLTRTSRGAWVYRTSPDPCLRFDNQTKTRTHWNGGSLYLHPKMSEYAAAIIKEAGLDPETATSDEMDALDIRFICNTPRCQVGTPDPTSVRTRLMSWRQAVKHATTHEYIGGPEWKVIPPNIAAKAQVTMGTSTEMPVWVCAHCRDLPKEPPLLKRENMMTHLQNAHSIESPEMNKDYYRDFSIPEHPFENLNSVHIRIKKKLLEGQKRKGKKSQKSRPSAQPPGSSSQAPEASTSAKSLDS